MGVVHIFDSSRRVEGQNSVAKSNANDDDTAQVVELITNSKLAKGINPRSVYRQMEAMLVTSGVDFSCGKVRADFKIVTYLVQGMMDRGAGMPSDRCLMLDTLRHALAYEEPVDTKETDELFGDLLGRLD